MKYTKIRRFIYKRDINLYLHEFNWDFKFIKSPYRKIKTIFNIEVSSVVLYLIHKTNLKPNDVTLAGVLWISLGCIMLCTNNNLLMLLGLLTFFTKRVLDIVDGSLAHIKKQYSKMGHELDLWAADINKILVITGFCFYIFNSTSNHIYLLLLILIIILNFIDPRKHLSSFKFSKIIYNKNLKTHSQKIKNESNSVVNFFKVFNYDGRSSYTDLIVVLIIIDMNYNIITYISFFPFLWLILNISILLRSLKKVF